MKSLGSTFPFLYYKICGIFTQIQQFDPLNSRPVVARFRDTYVKTSRKSISNEAQKKSFQ